LSSPKYFSPTYPPIPKTTFFSFLIPT